MFPSFLSFRLPRAERAARGACSHLARPRRGAVLAGGSARGRRRGIAFVYTALGLAGALMLAAIVIDVGLLYQRKAQMQRAADAAALAGAQRLANFKSAYEAEVFAGFVAGRPENGNYANLKYGYFKRDGKWYLGYYVEDNADSKFKVTYPVVDEDGVTQSSWFRVEISRPERSLFGGMWPLNREQYGVSASATALFETLAKLEIKGKGTYGVAPGPVNLSLFGPDGRYSYGDPYSTKFLNDGVTANPRYNSDGYNFVVNVPQNQGQTSVEIFDPDCYNKDNKPNASIEAIDELRTRNGTGNASHATNTKYTLYWDKGTSDPSDDVEVGTRSYGNDSTTDMQWINAFEFNRNSYQGGNFRLNVKSLSGSSENGFDLRAGPKRTSTQQFNPTNGTSIQAEGHLPINFNESGTTKMTLGTVPKEAAGGQLIITKFDTDINSKTITYTCDQLPGKSWPGKLSADGAFATDTITIPKEYRNAAADGIWYAEYVAGNQDTSVWDMSFTGNGPGRPGKVRLIK